MLSELKVTTKVPPFLSSFSSTEEASRFSLPLQHPTMPFAVDFFVKSTSLLSLVNYRCTPEYHYPTQYEDGETILRFLDENKSVLLENAGVSKCYLLGDSAGGNLAHHVAVRAYKIGLQKIRVIVLISIQSFFGGEELTEVEILLEGSLMILLVSEDWLWKVFLLEGSNRDHGAANVSGPNVEDLPGLDYLDTHVFVGGFDALN